MGGRGGSGGGGGSAQAQIKKDFRQETVTLTDKWGDPIETVTGYANSRGSFSRIEQNSDGTYSLEMGDTSRGPVASTGRYRTREDAYRAMYRYLKRR